MNLGQKGFSLIEILIAITLLAFVILGIATVSNNSIETKDRVTEEDNSLQEIQTALARMEWDFAHLYSPLYFSIKMQQNELDEEGAQIFSEFMNHYRSNPRFKAPSYEALPIPVLEQEDKDEIVFFTAANRRKFKNQKQSSFAWIRYSLEANDSEEKYIIPGTKVLKRNFMADDVFSREEFEWEKNSKSQILLENVDKIKYEWWDYKAKKWQDSLRSLTSNKDIIRAIKITLSIKFSEDEVVDYFKVFRPLFPYFKSENFYELEKIKDENFLKQGDQGALNEFE